AGRRIHRTPILLAQHRDKLRRVHEWRSCGAACSPSKPCGMTRRAHLSTPSSASSRCYAALRGSRHLGLAGSDLEGRRKQRGHKIGSTKTERLDVDLTAATKHCRYSRAERSFRPHQALDQLQVRAIEGREL